MSALFEPIQIGNMKVRNRVLRSATYYGLADEDGFVGEASVALIKGLAENDVGLVVTGFAYVREDGQSAADQNGIHTDDHIPGYRKMTDAVHDVDGHVVMQINHGGANAYTASYRGDDYVAVSVYEGMPKYRKPAREMTEEDIKGITDAYGQAARRVQESGFDGVQIHGAHGYLVSQFLSPVTNRRQDRWGGSLANRMRFVVDVTRAIRKEVDDDFPVMIKLGARDYLQNGHGLTIEEGAETARTLEQEGLCLGEISHGISTVQQLILGIGEPEQEACFRDDAQVVREATGGPTCLVAGFRSLPVIEEILVSGVTDMIGISRPLIREPNLIRRWKNGDTAKAECISCGGCFGKQERGTHRIGCRKIKQEGGGHPQPDPIAA